MSDGINIKVSKFVSSWWCFDMGEEVLVDRVAQVISSIEVSSSGEMCVVVVRCDQISGAPGQPGSEQSYVIHGPCAYELMPEPASQEEAGL